MSQAIETRYLGPTDTKGARVKASCQAGQLTVSWDHGLSLEANHLVAAKGLLAKLGWNEWVTHLAVGGSPDGNGFVYVLIDIDNDNDLIKV